MDPPYQFFTTRAVVVTNISNTKASFFCVIAKRTCVAPTATQLQNGRAILLSQPRKYPGVEERIYSYKFGFLCSAAIICNKIEKLSAKHAELPGKALDLINGERGKGETALYLFFRWSLESGSNR